MNTREAILAAANHLEANPEAWGFYRCAVPECGTKGCAAGWIRHFEGAAPGSRDFTIGGARYGDFQFRMDHIADDWTESGPNAAAALRLYADKYHPAEQVSA